MRICKIGKCGGEHVSRGWCGKHYTRWRVHGDPEFTKYTDKCSVEGCRKKHLARKYCTAHYRRLMKYGDVRADYPVSTDRGHWVDGGIGYIILADGKISMVSVEDFENISSMNWYYRDGYACSRSDGKSKMMHHVIIGKGQDHINRNPLDNRRCNLRPCTKSQNGANSKLSKRNTSGYRGVYWSKQKRKWHSSIKKDNKDNHIGFFMDKEEAALAWNEKAKELFGEFAYMNIITTNHYE